MKRNSNDIQLKTSLRLSKKNRVVRANSIRKLLPFIETYNFEELFSIKVEVTSNSLAKLSSFRESSFFLTQVNY